MQLILALASLWIPAFTASPHDAAARQMPPVVQLDLRVFPRTTPAPGAIRATAYVARDDGNIALTIEAECPDYLRRSTLPLDGASAPRKHVIVFESLPACTYEFRAIVHRRHGESLDASRVVIVTR